MKNTYCFKGLMILALTIYGFSGSAQGQIFVDASAPVAGADGQSWASAFPALDQALAVANPGDDVWVARGTYTPRFRTIPSDPRSVTFNIPTAVNVYGGFAGTETTLDQRAGLFSSTVLTGEIGTLAASDNAYHVVTMENNFAGCIVDGCVIRNGYAYGGPDENGGAARTFNANFAWFRNVTFLDNQGLQGGALYTNLTNLYTSNCTFRNNSSSSDGGAVYDRLGEHFSSNCFYFGNTSRGRGGAVAFRNSSSVNLLLNCVFSGNLSVGRGGAIFVQAGSQPSPNITIPGGSLIVTNCTVVQNGSFFGAGGGLWANESAPVPPFIEINNSIFYKNFDGAAGSADDQIGGVNQVSFCDVQGGYPGTANISADPQFVNPSLEDFRLSPSSPCRNVADNGLLIRDVLDVDNDNDFLELVPLDVYGARRIQQGIVDMGAAETILGDQSGKGVEF